MMKYIVGVLILAILTDHTLCGEKYKTMGRCDSFCGKAHERPKNEGIEIEGIQYYDEQL